MTSPTLQQDKIVRVGVACTIYHPNNDEILMIRRTGSHGAGSYSVPGGWMDFGETPANTARREVKEEVGLDLYGVLYESWTNDVFSDEGKHGLTLWFSAVAVGEPKILEPNKITEMLWVPSGGPFPRPLFIPFANRLGVAA